MKTLGSKMLSQTITLLVLSVSLVGMVACSNASQGSDGGRSSPVISNEATAEEPAVTNGEDAVDGGDQSESEPGNAAGNVTEVEDLLGNHGNIQNPPLKDPDGNNIVFAPISAEQLMDGYGTSLVALIEDGPSGKNVMLLDRETLATTPHWYQMFVIADAAAEIKGAGHNCDAVQILSALGYEDKIDDVARLDQHFYGSSNSTDQCVGVLNEPETYPLVKIPNQTSDGRTIISEDTNNIPNSAAASIERLNDEGDYKLLYNGDLLSQYPEIIQTTFLGSLIVDAENDDWHPDKVFGDTPRGAPFDEKGFLESKGYSPQQVDDIMQVIEDIDNGGSPIVPPSLVVKE